MVHKNKHVMKVPAHSSPLKYVWYDRARKSQDAAADKASMRWQLSQLRVYARRRHWLCLNGFVDVGFSALDMNRPGLVQLLEFCASHQVDMVLVRDFDRLCRRPKDGIELRRQFGSQNIRIVSTSNQDAEVLDDLFATPVAGNA
jgi:DNA invertase Pin-like site-specific DNA recombinase